MPGQSDEGSPSNEFEIGIFAERYELLSDSFIDINKTATALDAMIDRNATVFEIGIGTGYFAEQLTRAGHTVEGIQPKDEMLRQLRVKRPHLKVLAEEPIEEYFFSRHYDVIVSHSSVFLFTRHRQAFGESAEYSETLIFQSFIQQQLIVYENLLKALSALTPNGRLFVNVQNNPRALVEVGPAEDPLRFEMVDCNYMLSNRVVVKHFRSTYRGRSIVVEDRRYCASFEELRALLVQLGICVRRSADSQWVIFSLE